MISRESTRIGEAGFTLIELLVVFAVVGVLLATSIASFRVYRTQAAYASAEATMGFARRTAQASLTRDVPPAAVPLYSQVAAGPLSDALAADYLLGMQVPIETKLQVQYDPSCTAGGCESDFIQVNHCLGEEFLRWIRYGDGVEVLLENIGGSGCA